MKDTFRRIKELGQKDSQALRELYKEWIEAIEGWNRQPHVLYVNHMKTKVKTII